MADKVQQLPGTESKPSFAKLVENLIIELPAQLQYMESKAVMCRHTYLKLVEAGFTKNEAFQLCSKLVNNS